MSKIFYYWKGIFAEIWVMIILKITFHKIISYRYKSPCGEIDIIASRRNVLRFIEVKHRQDINILRYSYSSFQANRIKKASGYFVSKNRKYIDFVMSIDIFYVHNIFNVKCIKNTSI